MMLSILLLSTMTAQDTPPISEALNQLAEDKGQSLTTHDLDGLLEYDLVRPAGMPSDEFGPVLLVLPPGDQSRAMVDVAHNLYWRDEALRLGWTVVAPVAPQGERFQGDGLIAVMALVEHMEQDFAIEGGKLHLAGVSNGGRSAFALALSNPDRFASLSLLPGVPSEAGFDQLAQLKGLPLAMYVGGDDTHWRDAMQRVSKTLTELGSAPARFTIFEGEGHTPESLSGKTLFRTLESFRVQRVLTDFHDAASKADAKRYFEHFTEDAIFLGTDASERWSLPEFRAFAEPYFSKGQGWTYTAKERHAYLSPDGQSAWFDELLDNSSYGVTRGTGVLLRSEDRWRLAQYHLTIPVPNSLAKQLVELIRQQ